MNPILHQTCKMDKHKKIARTVFMVLLLTMVMIEIYCAKLSYENYGWWMPIFLYFLVFLNLLPVALFFKNAEIPAIILVVLLAVAIIPNQLTLTHKLMLEREEAGSITNYVYQQKILTGKFPANLNNYKFKYSALKDDFYYTQDGETSFTIHFSVGTTSTSHFFMHYTGTRWEYYDD